MTMRIFFLLAGAFSIALVGPHTASAHKIIASAYASGDVIEGEIGFSNGEMAANTKVVVKDGRGTMLGETTTDGDGLFIFTPTQKVIHVFEADLGAGHLARVTLSLDELPDITPEKSEGTIAATSVSTNDNSAPSAKSGAATQSAQDSAAVPAELIAAQQDMMAEMIRKELRPLRREIAAYKEKNDLQTILGGIGYIFGLFGLWFFLAARRRQSATPQATQSVEGKVSS